MGIKTRIKFLLVDFFKKIMPKQVFKVIEDEISNKVSRPLLSAIDEMKPNMYFAQEGEDVLLERIFERIKKGIYLDIGANDPVRFSNTYKLYLKGWHGYIVEPNKNLSKKFRQVRERDTVFNLGISDQNGFLVYYMYDETAYNTFSYKVTEELSALGITFIASSKVNVITLKEFIELIPREDIARIDFLNIDVEGLDLNVLISNDWTKFRPKVICVEDLESGKRESDQTTVTSFLLRQDYCLSSVLHNSLIFVDRNWEECKWKRD